MRDLISFVRHELARHADAGKARGMAAYMKTDMPFHGVQKPERRRIERMIATRFPIISRRAYIGAVTALWKLPHREEKYLAVAVARMFPQFITLASFPLYRRLIVEGAWWDFVDEAATHLVGRVLLLDRQRAGGAIDRWIDHENLWLRRASLLCQIGHKTQTDERRLFDTCIRRAADSEFFIRKAIGWALRDYAWTNPKSVSAFLRRHGGRFSALSVREASKNLEKYRQSTA